MTDSPPNGISEEFWNGLDAHTRTELLKSKKNQEEREERNSPHNPPSVGSLHTVIFAQDALLYVGEGEGKIQVFRSPDAAMEAARERWKNQDDIYFEVVELVIVDE